MNPIQSATLKPEARDANAAAQHSRRIRAKDYHRSTVEDVYRGLWPCHGAVLFHSLDRSNYF